MVINSDSIKYIILSMRLYRMNKIYIKYELDGSEPTLLD